MLDYLKDIISLANHLDRCGFISEADILDEVIKKIAGNSCYPEGYEDGKKYGRDEMAKLFSCIADGKGWPEDLAKEVYFPYLPGKKDVEIDPAKIEVGPNKYITIEEFVAREKKKYPAGWARKKIKISEDMIHPDSIDFISKKKSANGYKKRIELQKDRIRKMGLINITKDEPIMLEKVGKKYKIREGWHRVLSILEMMDSGELKNPVVMAGVATPK